MKQRMLALIVAGAAVLLTTGCKSWFPSNTTTVESHWHSYADVQADFNKIVPYQTRTNDLKGLGFDPNISANINVLTYVDIIQIFMPNPGIRLKDLPAPVQDCIGAREKSCAYQVDFNYTNSHRYGNLVLDIFNFRRKTHVTGWDFKGLILVKDGTIVYKLSSGEPRISRNETTVHPLGPLQEVDGSIMSFVSIPH